MNNWIHKAIDNRIQDISHTGQVLKDNTRKSINTNHGCKLLTVDNPIYDMVKSLDYQIYHFSWKF